MDFYVIPPNDRLELMEWGDRYFCLAQQYKKDSNYRQYFQQKVKEGAWVTLDNGAGDHDTVTAKDLLYIMTQLGPSEVIPPDILFDGIQTIRNLETFTRSMYDTDQIGRIEVLACPQGRDLHEWRFVYEYMLKHPLVNTIGLSKIAVPKAFLNAEGDKMIMQARQMCIRSLAAKGLIQKPLHFLGMGDPREFHDYKNLPADIKQFIRSTDSCNTVWSGLNNILFSKGNFERIPTPKDYFDRLVPNVTAALDNIEWFRQELSS